MRAAKIDSNQNQIVAALRDLGCSVMSIAAVGCGCPDLLVGFRGRNFLLEVKSEKGTLTPYQKALFGMWKGQMNVVRNVDEAIKVISR